LSQSLEIAGSRLSQDASAPAPKFFDEMTAPDGSIRLAYASFASLARA
jgi:hypothetical protein